MVFLTLVIGAYCILIVTTSYYLLYSTSLSTKIVSLDKIIMSVYNRHNCIIIGRHKHNKNVILHQLVDQKNAKYTVLKPLVISVS